MVSMMSQTQSGRGALGRDPSGRTGLARVKSVATVLVTGLLETLAALLIAVVSLCGQVPPGSRPSTAPPIEARPALPAVPGQGPDYIISPDDDLEIDVMDLPELSHEYRVSPTGSISIVVLKDPIVAAGLTPRRLTEVIAQELQTAGMVDNPHIAIQVKQSRLHSVAILGAVKKPQIYPLFGTTTLMDALSQAEGLAVDAGNTAIVTRGGAMLAPAGKANGKDQATSEATGATTTKVDLNRLLEQGDPDSNVTLYPGDRVTVQRAGIIYVVGAVNKSGGFVLANDREQITVLKAVALAESLKNTAMPKKSVIIRKDPRVPGATSQIAVDLKKILANHAPDQVLQADDLLFIPESGTKKAGLRAVEALAQGSSLLFYRIP